MSTPRKVASALNLLPDSGGQYTFINLSESNDGRAHHAQQEIHRHAMRRNGLARRRKPRNVTIELQLAQIDCQESMKRGSINAYECHSRFSSSLSSKCKCLLYDPVDAVGLAHLATDHRTLELLQFSEWESILCLDFW